MNQDFRLAVDFADHPKIEKAIRRLGEQAFRCIVRLFGWTARNRPDGLLQNMSAEDIAIAARWPGDPDQFCQTLSDLRILDRSDEYQSFLIHDWRQHNEWVSEENGRHRHARKLNHQKWHVARGRYEPQCSFCSSDTDPDVAQSGIRTESDAESSPRFGSERNKGEGPVTVEAGTTEWQRKVGRVLAIFRPGDPKPEAALVARWLSEYSADDELLADVLRPHLGNSIPYLVKVVENRANIRKVKEGNGRKRKSDSEDDSDGRGAAFERHLARAGGIG